MEVGDDAVGAVRSTEALGAAEAATAIVTVAVAVAEEMSLSLAAAAATEAAVGRSTAVASAGEWTAARRDGTDDATDALFASDSAVWHAEGSNGIVGAAARELNEWEESVPETADVFEPTEPEP